MGQVDRAVVVGSRDHGPAPWDKTMAGSADTAVRRGLGRSTVRPTVEGWVGTTLRQVPIHKGADAIGPCRTRQGPGRSQEKSRGTRPGCARHSHDAAFVVQRTGMGGRHHPRACRGDANSGCTRCHEGLRVPNHSSDTHGNATKEATQDRGKILHGRQTPSAVAGDKQCITNVETCQASGKGSENPKLTETLRQSGCQERKPHIQGPDESRDHGSSSGHAAMTGSTHAVRHRGFICEHTWLKVDDNRNNGRGEAAREIQATGCLANAANAKQATTGANMRKK
ncbi:hypothetical protein V6N12_035415 [Hibiscus sabdariffa]|uniref:Uncharacterized protein n=1 Tax=Hibiscus sabdariffa TaxID=183260 RepID=A0ABR2EMN3_9ROSI